MTPLDPARYRCQHEALGPFADRFEALAPDLQSEAWLAEHTARPHGALHRALTGMLAPFMPLYDVHGLTGGYPMHLLSTAQLRALVGDGHRRILDVGAGGGFVTQYARPLANEIVCTETSRPLARRLRAQGYPVFLGDLGATSLDDHGGFDAILCLNVLDRTPYPRRLLRALHTLARSPAPLLVSVPLPLSPAVLVAGGSVDPLEALPRARGDFEQGMRDLCEQLFGPEGFRVDRLARAPYLSKGDAGQAVYVLDAGLFVLRPG